MRLFIIKHLQFINNQLFISFSPNPNLKALADLGVTIEEYASFYGKYSETLADYLGLEYKQKFENGWIVFSVTEKK